jgi:GAF domain-containing protein
MSKSRSAKDESAIRNYPRLLKRYARLLDVSSELVSTLEQGTLLQHIAEVARELTTSEASSILLYDPQTNHLYFEAATGPLQVGFFRIRSLCSLRIRRPIPASSPTSTCKRTT